MADMTDAELMELVAAVTADTRPPARVLEAAYASQSWANFDSELAVLMADSVDLVGSGVRADANRRLVFECGAGVAEVDLDADNFRMTVRVDSPSRVEVEYAADDVATVVATEEGTTIVVDHVALGPARLIITSTQGRWRTGWFTL